MLDCTSTHFRSSHRKIEIFFLNSEHFSAIPYEVFWIKILFAGLLLFCPPPVQTCASASHEPINSDDHSMHCVMYKQINVLSLSVNTSVKPVPSSLTVFAHHSELICGCQTDCVWLHKEAGRWPPHARPGAHWGGSVMAISLLVCLFLLDRGICVCFANSETQSVSGF